MDTAASSGSVRFDWRLVAAIGALSVVTMPLTAMWFLLLGFLVLLGTAIAALLPMGRGREPQVLGLGGSVALGLLIGPAIYIALAVLV